MARRSPSFWRNTWRDFGERKVLITGGSRGLGLALARLLAADGARVALLARSEATLHAALREIREQLDAEVEVVACDLREPARLEAAIAGLVQRWGHLDVLINNAGIIAPGALERTSLGEFEDAMTVHFWAPLRATRAVLPGMIERGEGRIVNVSAIEGRVALPRIAPYCASKFALTGLSNALRAELAQQGVYVTTVVPGLMHSAIATTATDGDAIVLAGMPRWIAHLARAPLVSTSYEQAALRIARACRRGERWLVLDGLTRLLLIADALAPSALGAGMELANRALTRRQQSRP
jgi:short-subunit dehydrogenase